MISSVLRTAGAAALLALSSQLAPSQASAQEINASVLPNGRSVETNSVASYFVAVSNSGSATAENCAVSLGFSNTAPVTLTYQTADGSLNLTGAADTPADIAAGATQFFVIGLTPTAEYDGAVPLRYACDNATALGRPGVNDVVLVAQDGPNVPDILSISLTPSADGVIRVAAAGGVQVMTISAVYPGPGADTADIRVTPSIPDFDGVAGLEICETDSDSVCTSARGDFVDTTFTQDEIKFFAIFLDAPDEGGLPLYPDLLRVRASFVDQEAEEAAPEGAGETDAPQAGPPYTRSITSQAAYAPAPGDAETTGEGFYQFRIRDLVNDPSGDFTAPGEMVVTPDGQAMGAIQVIEGATPYWQVFSLDGNFNPEGGSGPVFGGDMVLYETHDGHSALTGRFTMRYEPASGFLAQFDGRAAGAPPITLSGPSYYGGGDQPVYFRQSLLQMQALMITALWVATIGDLTGAYTVLDPQSQAIIGNMTVTGSLVTGLFTLPGDPVQCEMNMQMNRQIATASLVLADVIISQCGAAGLYNGLGVIDTVTNSSGMLLRLYLASQIQGLYLTALVAGGG